MTMAPPLRAIVDPYAYADRSNDELFTELRRSEPVARVELEEYSPFWALTKFDDIKLVEAGQDCFGVADQHFCLITTDEFRDLTAKREQGDMASSFRVLPMLDEPEHHKHRKILSVWFTPAKVARQSEVIRKIATKYVDRLMVDGPDVDFAQATSYFPLEVILELSGIPVGDESELAEMVAGLRPDASGTANRTMGEMYAYLEKLVAERRRQPQDDMISVLANGRIDGELLSLSDLFGAFLTLLTAGHETTSAAIAAGGWVLAERPELLQRIKDDPRLCSTFFEESVRHETPVKHFMRTCLQDTELRGVKIKTGDWLMLCYASGNRDEERFADAASFSLDRRNGHVGFGHGAHICIGQYLARMEGRLFWETLLPRIKGIRLAGSPVRNPSNIVCGPEHVPVHIF